MASKLKHAEMVAIVERGESFIHDGQIINHMDNIPAPEALADTEDEQQLVGADLDAQIATLQARRAKLQKAAPKAVQPAEKAKPAEKASDAPQVNHPAAPAAAPGSQHPATVQTPHP